MSPKRIRPPPTSVSTRSGSRNVKPISTPDEVDPANRAILAEEYSAFPARRHEIPGVSFV